MASGEFDITPGKTLADGEKLNNTKIMQILLGMTARLKQGAVTERELESRLVMRRVDTIAAMKSYDWSAHSDDDLVYLEGYNAQNDGGGGFFWVDKEDVSTVDNGGTVIVANDGTRLKRYYREGDRLSVAWWGFFPDAADSHPERLQAAMDAYPRLYIPEGSYNCTGANTLYPRSGTDIEGVPGQTILVMSTGSQNANLPFGLSAFIAIWGHFGEPSDTDPANWTPRPNRYLAGQSSHVQAYRIEAQGRGQHTVTVTADDLAILTADAAAGDLSKGDVVRVRWGKGHNDADDAANMAPGDRVHEIADINSATGVITLRTPVRWPINGYGWEATGGLKSGIQDMNTGLTIAEGDHVVDVNDTGKVYRASAGGTTNANTVAGDSGATWEESPGKKFYARDMASGLAVVAGDYVVDVNDTGQMYKCEAGGTTNANTVASDTGATWESLPVVANMGSLWVAGSGAVAGIDGTALMVKVPVPIKNVRMSGLVITRNVAGGAPAAIVGANALNVQFEKIEIHSNGYISGGLVMTNGSNQITIDNWREDQVNVGLGNYFLDLESSSAIARNVHRSSNDISPNGVILLEFGADMRIYDSVICRAQNNDPIIRLTDNAQVWVTNSELMGGFAPVYRGGPVLSDDGIPDVFSHGYIREFHGNVVHTHSAIVWRNWIKEEVHRAVGNNYTFYNKSNVIFRPKGVVNVRIPIVMQGYWESTAAKVLTLDLEMLDRYAPLLNARERKLALFRAGAFFDANAGGGAGVSCELYFKREDSGGSFQHLLSSTAAGSTIEVSDTAPHAETLPTGGDHFFDYLTDGDNRHVVVEITPSGLHYRTHSINVGGRPICIHGARLCQGRLCNLRRVG
jgi:hypothetical protein